MSEQKEQNEEQKLYEVYMSAQYAYFRHIEPIRIAEINARIQGKVKNPFHWKTKYEEELKKTDTQANPSSPVATPSKDYRKLFLLFHPDKNCERIEEATKHFQFLQQLLTEGETDTLDRLLTAADPWKMIGEISDTFSVYKKAKYCEHVRKMAWFNWTTDDDAQFITEEELETLLKTNIAKLEKENAILRDFICSHRE
jgi:hypothetical protein